MQTTKVNFLLDETGEVFAFFPDEHYNLDLDPDLFQSYAHIGQHSAASLTYAKGCKAATQVQYFDLFEELRSIGYSLLIIPVKPVKLTKKAFKEIIHYSCYTGNQVKFHCIYYDHDPGIYGERSAGYKYAYAVSSQDANKTELFNLVYNHITKKFPLPWWIYSRTADSDKNRFKVGISLDLSLFN